MTTGHGMVWGRPMKSSRCHAIVCIITDRHKNSGKLDTSHITLINENFQRGGGVS